MGPARLAPLALGLLAFCVAAETVQQISFKLGADRAGRSAGFVRGVALEPLIWAGAALWVVESVAWVLVLQRAPLSLAYPVMTLTYACVPLAGLVMLRESMSARQKLGAALIFAGVVCIGASGA
ncbi:permease [Phenylobacterium hankyongense]|uniref:Permease n=1 Tax=Phenylobacterium hankyongense TaxID=1813876 RepID=A0A328AUY1_9CAUL|nr:permease [Phenylobacterium hankyongense]RAK58427.1 permease [Phenylobacterium hankyongense]